MIKKLVALLHRRRDDRDKGTLTLEFAFVAPILTVAVLGAADIGVLMNTAASQGRHPCRGGIRQSELEQPIGDQPHNRDRTTGLRIYRADVVERHMFAGDPRGHDLLHLRRQYVCQSVSADWLKPLRRSDQSWGP